VDNAQESSTSIALYRPTSGADGVMEQGSFAGSLTAAPWTFTDGTVARVEEGSS
jgi:hypothetical protein